jgi:hypothetical protein
MPFPSTVLANNRRGIGESQSKHPTQLKGKETTRVLTAGDPRKTVMAVAAAPKAVSVLATVSSALHVVVVVVVPLLCARRPADMHL